MVGYKRAAKLKTKIQRRDERIAQLERSKKSMQEKVIYLDGELAANQMLIAQVVKQRDLHLEHVGRQEQHIIELEQANSKLKQDLEYADIELATFKEDASKRSAASLEIEITHALNFWGADNDLNTPDYILANHLYRHLMDLKRMLEATAKWRGSGMPTAPKYDGPVAYSDEEFGVE